MSITGTNAEIFFKSSIFANDISRQLNLKTLIKLSHTNSKLVKNIKVDAIIDIVKRTDPLEVVWLINSYHVPDVFLKAFTSNKLDDYWRNQAKTLFNKEINNYSEFVSEHRAILDTMDSYFKVNTISEKLKTNKYFMMLAINHSHYNIQYVNQILFKDREFMLTAIKKHWQIMRLSDNELKINQKFLLDALKISDNVADIISPTLLKDKLFMLRAISICPRIYFYASKEIKGDVEVLIQALKGDAINIVIAPDDLRNNKQYKNIAKITDKSERIKACNVVLENFTELKNSSCIGMNSTVSKHDTQV